MLTDADTCTRPPRVPVIAPPPSPTMSKSASKLAHRVEQSKISGRDCPVPFWLDEK